MRSSGRNSSGRGNRSAGGAPRPKAGQKRDEKQQRAGRPRPEERRYDVGGSGEGQGGARREARRGGPRGVPRAARRSPGAAAGPRRAHRPGASPRVRRPGGGAQPRAVREPAAEAGPGAGRRAPAEGAGPRGYGSACLRGAHRGGPRRGQRLDRGRAGPAGRPGQDEIKVDGLTVATQLPPVLRPQQAGRRRLHDGGPRRPPVPRRLRHQPGDPPVPRGRLDTQRPRASSCSPTTSCPTASRTPGTACARPTWPPSGPDPRDLGKRLKEGVQLEDGYAGGQLPGRRADRQELPRRDLPARGPQAHRAPDARRVGFPVDKLVRTAFGPIALGDQKSGWLRRLTNTEVGMLMKEVDL